MRGSKGWIPLGQAALLRAFELNGTQVDNNKRGLRVGPPLRAWSCLRCMALFASPRPR